MPLGSLASSRSSIGSSIASKTRQAVGGRGHLPEEIGLLSQGGQVGDALPAVGQGHRQVHQHSSRVVAAAPRHQLGQRVRESRVQPATLRHLGQQPAPGVAHEARSSGTNP
jgi:hypothetical protein